MRAAKSAASLASSLLLAGVVAGSSSGCARPCPTPPAGPYRWEPAAKRVGAPPPKPEGATRFLVGGDSRESFPGEGPDGVPRDRAGCDLSAPLPAAFASAGPSGASAFLYLGDMERAPPSDTYFPAILSRCLDKRVTFCPVFGNHEALEDGASPLLHPEVARDEFVQRDLRGCVGQAGIAPEARAADRVFYAVDLPGNVHFVALDNVSADGFGKEQLAWLGADLAKARGAHATIVVGMHKALADNHVTHHSMDEDAAFADSQAALAAFEANGVALVLASHEHGYWELRQGSPGAPGLHGFITGGLGAPLKACAGPDHAFFHYLVVDVVGGRVDVHVVATR